MSKTGSRGSGLTFPYVLEFEDLALSILKGDAGGKERLKELLEEYASKYAEESFSGA